MVDPRRVTVAVPIYVEAERDGCCSVLCPAFQEAQGGGFRCAAFGVPLSVGNYAFRCPECIAAEIGAP